MLIQNIVFVGQKIQKKTETNKIFGEKRSKLFSKSQRINSKSRKITTQKSLLKKAKKKQKGIFFKFETQKKTQKCFCIPPVSGFLRGLSDTLRVPLIAPFLLDCQTPKTGM